MVTVPGRDGEPAAAERARQREESQTRLACPFGHSFSTDLPPGSLVKCGQCRKQGDSVTVTVPGGPPASAPARPGPKNTGWAGPCSRCRTWSRCPPGQELAPGWLMLTLGTDPPPTRKAG
jgi:hypothetical protein